MKKDWNKIVELERSIKTWETSRKELMELLTQFNKRFFISQLKQAFGFGCQGCCKEKYKSIKDRWICMQNQWHYFYVGLFSKSRCVQINHW